MFSVPTKVDYGLLIMAVLAEHWPRKCSLHEIANDKNLSKKYLSQVMIPLHKAGLVTSKEGKYGGYVLGRAPNDISVRDIVEAIEGPLNLVRCMKGENQCPAEQHCTTQVVWNRLKYDIYNLLDAKNLADIVQT